MPQFPLPLVIFPTYIAPQNRKSFGRRKSSTGRDRFEYNYLDGARSLSYFLVSIVPSDPVHVLSPHFSTMFVIFRNSWAYLFNNDPGELVLT